MPALASDPDANGKKTRTRSPAYPYLDLRSALDKAATLWKAEGRHAAAVHVVMHHWGYKEESSTGHSCMAALKKFGLIELEGLGENKQVRLSGLAQAILLDENPASPARVEALRVAALGPRIHAELWERYGSDLPSDQSLKRHLVLEKGFNEAVVDELIAEYKGTVAFAGLDLLPAPPVATIPAAAARTAPAPSARSLEELPYDWREASSAAAPPARAIGLRQDRPETHRTAAPSREAQVGAGREPVVAARAAAEPGSLEARRRDAPPVYAPADRATELELLSRYDQEGLGYEDEYLPPGRMSGYHSPTFATPMVPPVPAPRAATTGPAAGVPPAAASGIEIEATNGVPRKELPVPLDGDRVALVPYPMTEEDFSLLIDTLQLWKKRLVR